MFERFTDRARRVLVLAQEEAWLLNHNFIGTEHILLGLVREGQGVAAQVLVSLGADPSRVRQQVTEVLAGSRSPADEARAQSSGPRPQLRGLPTSRIVRRSIADGDVCSLCGRDLWEVGRYLTAGTIKVCEQCVAVAGEVIKSAELEGRGPALRLPPRVFGEPPDGDAVAEIVTAFERAFAGAANAPELAGRLEDCWVERIGFTGADRARVRFGIRLTSGVTFPVEGTAVLRNDRSISCGGRHSTITQGTVGA